MSNLRDLLDPDLTRIKTILRLEITEASKHPGRSGMELIELRSLFDQVRVFEDAVHDFDEDYRE